jgi:hypothetical protein
MKQMIRSTVAGLTISLLLWLPVRAQSPTTEVASTSAEVDFEVIKENVKKRLQEVVQDKVLGDITKEKVAIFGTLKSRAGNTLTIEADNSIKLASTSAQTQVVRIPSAGDLTLDDVSLDDYVVALGYSGFDEVLDTRKIIIQRTPPAMSQYKTAFGRIATYSTKDFLLTLTNPADEAKSTYIVSRKAVIQQAFTNDEYVDLPRNQSLPENKYALVIYMPSEDKEEDHVAYRVLIKSDPPELLQNDNDQ